MGDVKLITRKRKIDNAGVFKISRMKEVIKPTVPHKHDGYHEFVFLFEGAGVHTIDEVDYEVNPPIFFYLKTGQVHCWEFTQIPKGYVVIFKDEFLSEFDDNIALLSKIPAMMRLNKDHIRLKNDFEALFHEYSSSVPDEKILKAYHNVIIYRILHAVEEHKNIALPISPIVNKFKRLVDLNYKEHRELSFYAELLKTNSRKLGRQCVNDLGRTANSIIGERLVVESKRLLRYTNQSISEIAYELKFKDPSYFVRFFKTKTKLTPLEFRKRF